MPEHLHPGVFVEEVPTGPRPIVAGETDVTGFVGQTRKGPTGEPVTVASESEFHLRFGRRTHRWGMGTAISDFFGNGGRRAVVVRVPDDAGLADYAGAPEPGSDDDPGGLAALDRSPTRPSVLVLPPRRPQQQVPDELWAVAADIALAHRMFLVIDPPPGLEPEQVEPWVDGLGLGGSPDATLRCTTRASAGPRPGRATRISAQPSRAGRSQASTRAPTAHEVCGSPPPGTRLSSPGCWRPRPRSPTP